VKALLYTGAKTLEYREVADPEPDTTADEVLVRVDSVGICGSDMHAWLGHDTRRPAPLILGHEAAGVVVGGEDDGRRVTVNPLVSCGSCKPCLSGRDNLCIKRQIISMPPREGAFAECLRMPRRNLTTIPASVPFGKGALAEPIACGWHAVKLASARLQSGLADARTLVIGGGPIGVGAALSAQCQGAGSVVVVEPNASRREYLLKQGEVDVRAPESLDPKASFDLVIDGVGLVVTREQASRVVEPGGLIMHIGLGSAEGGLDIRRMTLQEVSFIGTYTYTANEFRDVATAIAEGRLGKLDWIEQRSLADGADAFVELHAGSVAVPKIILKP